MYKHIAFLKDAFFCHLTLSLKIFITPCDVTSVILLSCYIYTKRKKEPSYIIDAILMVLWIVMVSPMMTPPPPQGAEAHERSDLRSHQVWIRSNTWGRFLSDVLHRALRHRLYSRLAEGENGVHHSRDV